ncbi:glycosyltransferase [Acetobacter fallax]|uniref:Glycosyltransferase n=1 Tax=Acetobacter fallax TaxID=1737473 RepID=A0ABX0K923_9PROT|nr:glycosyltransferase [Acetobacter fallax]NHO32920.1 glycosyltransferase [Acetobacter fallax]NHO36541.1 glycosyltransferase [Acetobacter fallax]
MRILHCILTHEFAGTERYLSELARMQAEHHEVTVLVARQTRDSLTGGDLVPHLAPPVRVIRAGRGGYLSALIGLSRRWRPDVIHTHVGAASFRAGVLNRLHRGPLRRFLPGGAGPAVVATLHRGFARRAYGGHDGLICIANWQRAGIPASFPGPVETIANWTCPAGPAEGARERLLSETGLGPDTFLLGAAGRMIPEKGFDTLLDAFSRADLPDTALILFGDGPSRAALQVKAGPNVIFTGFRTALRSDLAGLDAFVLPSRREPFGLVLLEAMAAGLPVLATNAGGVPDILGAHPECMVPPDEPAVMAAGLEMLRRRPKQIWDLASFDPRGQVARTEAFYRHCMAWKERTYR